MPNISPDPSSPENLPAFSAALGELVALARKGHAPASPLFNPSDDWLVAQGRLFGGLSDSERETTLAEWSAVRQEGDTANAEGKAAVKAGDAMTPAEMQTLIQQRHLVDKSSNCPHGRPTTLRFLPRPRSFCGRSAAIFIT